jgi:biotin operon repressor
MISQIVKLTLIALVAGWAGPASAAQVDWSRVGEVLGKPGTLLPGGIYKVALPRTDLKVTLDGVHIKPGFALGGWLAFEAKGRQAMIMGDLVLTQDEVNPVMKKLEEGGIEITGLHNHLLRAEPLPMYMHVFGKGDPVKLATALHAGLALSGTPLGAASGASWPQAATEQINFDTAAVDKVIGYKGKANGGIYQFGIPRAEPIKQDGMEIPTVMGTAIGINFQPTGAGKAAITGDFVLTAKEVNTVLRALRDNGIEVTALHNHMLDEQPRIFFMHYWANADALKLAKGLRAALEEANVQHP